jgi:photosystem II stability/assembly factor-like uncharacterized protein
MNFISLPKTHLRMLSTLAISLMPISLCADASWIRRPSNSTTDLRYVSSGPSGFLAGGSRTLLHSTDGISWSTIDAPSSGTLNTTSNGSDWIVADINSGGLYTYSSGGTFSNRVQGPWFTRLATRGSTVVAAGRDGVIKYSTDGGSSWLIALSPTQNDIDTISATQNGFVAIAEQGEVLSSTDGIYWNSLFSGSIEGHVTSTGLSSGSNCLVFTYFKYAYKSVDGGVNWIKNEITDQSISFNDIEYANGSFIAVGDSGRISISRDQGNTWSSMESSVSADLRSIAYSNGRWVATGSNGVILTLDDSISNLQVDLDIRLSVELRWQSQIGVNYRVYSSTDLKTWSEEGSPIIGDGSVMSKHKTIEGTKRFFRVLSN